MNKIPTIDEIAATIYQPIKMTCNEFAIELAKKVAEIHVKAALKEASEKAILGKMGAFGTYWNRTDLILDKDSILNSYPLENIK